MAHTNEKGRLTIADPQQPWVWRMKLTEQDFLALQTRLVQTVADHKGGHAHLWANQEAAQETVIYMAEWYKRCYEKDAKDALQLTSDELEKVWTAAGISDQLLYTDATGARRLRYSIYVLGGLAVRHEVRQKSFLKQLCRLYYGGDCTADDLKVGASAVAFRESIRQHHSLWHLLAALLNEEEAYAASDLQDEDSDIRRFLTAVKTANDEVLREKFRLEWIYTLQPDTPVVLRRLRLWLNPEVNGKEHQYLTYERLTAWGVTGIGQATILKFSVRFLCGGETILPADFEKPIITYWATGDQEAGFVAWGKDRSAMCSHVPTCKFDKVEICMQTDTGKEMVVQTFRVDDCSQLWRTDTGGMDWSDVRRSQHDTMVVFRDGYEVVEDDNREPVRDKTCYNKQFGPGEQLHFCLIKTVVKVKYGDEILLFYNHAGYDRICPRLYHNIIRYEEGELVEYWHKGEQELLPLIFSPDDLQVCHTHPVEDDEDPVIEKLKPESVQWKGANGLYQDWQNGNEPPYGVVMFRAEVKGSWMNGKAVFLSCYREDAPIARDLENHVVRYKNFEGEELSYRDDIRLTDAPLEPTCTIGIGTEDDYVELEVFRPIAIREVIVDGKVMRRTNDPVTMPYILKDRTVLQAWSKDGYLRYDCSRLDNVYQMIDEKVKKKDDAALSLWKKGEEYEIARAPRWFKVVYGNKQFKRRAPLYWWNYDERTEPKEMAYTPSIADNSILFQSMQKVDRDMSCGAPITRNSPFGSHVKSNIAQCFEMAVKHKTYFFIFEPLKKFAQSVKNDPKQFRLLEEALKEHHGGQLTEEDLQALRRFREEFDLDIE